MSGGRPTKCSSELTKQFADLMAAGNFRETVCAYIGIHRSTAENWMSDGEEAWVASGGNLDEIEDDNRRLWAEFFYVTRKAEARAEIRNVAIVNEAAGKATDGDPRNAQWWLEKRHPETWGQRKQKLEHTGADGGPVQVHWIDRLREACGEEDDGAK